ncbi:MAG: hypothetical protein ABI182_03810 [Candidatus Baltobacteraceae bacterium]
MNWESFADPLTRGALQLDWLAAALEPVSEYGRREFALLVPFSPGQIEPLRANLKIVDRFAKELDPSRVDAIRDALRAAPDAIGAIARGAMGETFTDAALLEVQRFCDVVGRVRGLLEGVRAWSSEAPGEIEEVARALERGRSGKFGFYLADGFDETLSAARAAAGAAQAEYDVARRTLAERVCGRLGREDIGSDEFILMREDLRGDLPSDVHLIREAPTYYLCELKLDGRSLEALARRDAAAESVAQAEEAVRARLSDVVRRNSAGLNRECGSLGRIDLLIAKVRFAQQHDCVMPEIVAEASIAFEDGRFLPLADELARSGREYFTISLDLHDVAVLTGPNMGGKSAALRACGFIAACTAFGIPVPARSARVGLFARVGWLGIGGDEEPGGLLSSFAKEVIRLREVLARGTSQVLVLVDEFARTTTPHEGKALLVALIERLRAAKGCAFIATHLPGVAGAAGTRHFGVRGLRKVPQSRVTADVPAALAELAAQMDYTIAEISEDQEPQTDAIALAQLLGLDDELIAAARMALTWTR